MRRGPALLLAAMVGGCFRPALAPEERVAPEDAPRYAAEVHALARQIEHEPTHSRRASLSRDAMASAQRCEQAAPGTPACDYALGIALGIQAREHPSTVREALAKMAAALRRAAAADPELDHAGPDRVLALLLLRAPGWPLGPGDPEDGLLAARRAVSHSPGYAPNQLALAEALLANEEKEAGREAARHALVLVEEAAANGDPDAAGWRREARKLLDAP